MKPLLDRWTEAERAELVPKPRAEPRPPQQASFTSKGGGFMTDMERLAEAARLAELDYSKPDRRTDEQYREEVAYYLEKGRDYFATLVAYRHANSGGLVSLELVNDSLRSYSGVHVEVKIPGKITALNPDGLREPEPPARPRKRGKRVPFHPVPYLQESGWKTSGRLLRRTRSGSRSTIQDQQQLALR